MKTKTVELNKNVFPYILDCITPENYDIVCNSEKEKLQFLYNTFVSEYWEHQKRYYGYIMYKTFENWLMGLPSCFVVDFENYVILELAYKWGSLQPEDKEAKKEKIIANWFNFITAKTFQLFKKYKIDMQ